MKGVGVVNAHASPQKKEKNAEIIEKTHNFLSIFFLKQTKKNKNLHRI